jgi:predicted ArsR family transcriptional regulator
MESTREQVLHVLQSSGGATVAAVAKTLGVGQASVRRHLDHLRVDGLADVRTERHGVGRPAFVFYTTEAAEERSPAGYSRLLSRLYKGLRTLEKGEVRGRDGTQVLRKVFDGVAQQVALEHRSEVVADTLEGRVVEASQSLEREGIVDGWTKEGDRYLLKNTACPYRMAALTTHGTCELDRKTIELLIGAPVRQVGRIADGQPACEYIVGEPVRLNPDLREESLQADA